MLKKTILLTTVVLFIFGVCFPIQKGDAFIFQRPHSFYTRYTYLSTEVTLDGSWSSYPNKISSFLVNWEKIEGEQVTIRDANALQTTFTTTKEGVYVFRLTITVNGISSSDEVSILVKEDFIPEYKATIFEGASYDGIIEYDANGNMTQIGGRNISYDYENRPKTIVMPTEEGKVITYTYDYAGQRVKKEVRDKDRAEQVLTGIADKLEELGFSQFSRIFERFILQKAGRRDAGSSGKGQGSRRNPPQQNPPSPSPSQESEITYYIGNLYEVGYSSTTTVTTKYIYANGVRIAKSWTRQSSSGGGSKNIQYYHSDHLGSSNVITDEAGNKVQLLEYVPFGQTRTEQGTASVDYRFTGQMLDNDAGLYYYNARWYEPVIGKFVTPDPVYPFSVDEQKRFALNVRLSIANLYNPQKLNRFAYCTNNPLRYVDPTGLELTVSGSEEYMSKAEQALQKISPRVSVDKKTGKVTIDTTKSAEGYEKGDEVLYRLIETEKHFNINESEDVKTIPHILKDASNPKKGTGANILWNPNKEAEINTLNDDKTSSKQKSPAYIGLAHELIHAEHAERGTFNTSRAQTTYTGLDGRQYSAPVEEQTTVGVGLHAGPQDITENDIRGESRVGLRASY